MRIRNATPMVLAAVTGALSLAACSSAADPAGAGSATTGSNAAAFTGTVEIRLTAAEGCVATPNTVPAGPVTFHVTNVDAAGVTEVEIVSGQRIRGEKENLAPGFDANFSAKLDGGAYEVYCPGASTERSPFTVTGAAATATGDTKALLDTAVGEYADYVAGQAGELVAALPALKTAIAAGDVEGAKRAYAAARLPYEKIEPVAESFGDLDPAIDQREGDVEAGTEWTGFHPIEQDLWTNNSTTKAATLIDKLIADSAELKARTTQLATDTKAGNGKGYNADEIANGAVALLDEVQKSKITGEEEAYSHLDIVDFRANVEGSMQAFAILRPALDAIDPSIAPPIADKFTALETGLSTLKDGNSLGGYLPYDKVTAEQKKMLTDALLAVIEPLSKVSAKIASA